MNQINIQKVGFFIKFYLLFRKKCSIMNIGHERKGEKDENLNDLDEKDGKWCC